LSAVEVIRASALGGIPHGFLGRRGGVSEGDMSGLNTGYGSGDDPGLIAENRRRSIHAVLPRARIATVHQVHSGTAVRVEQPWAEEERPRADAMVTDRPGLLLGILTADCAPILLADSVAGVVGAAHAGWRGALEGVTDATIDLMEQLGADRDRITAAVGPCIGQSSYEVDEAFRARFVEDDPNNDRFFGTGPADKPHFDLQAYVRHRLIAAGIGEVESLRLDTYTDPDRFFSYRRSTHRNEPSYGRQISLIGLSG
jgi:YfiH family protein